MSAPVFNIYLIDLIRFVGFLAAGDPYNSAAKQALRPQNLLRNRWTDGLSFVLSVNDGRTVTA